MNRPSLEEGQWGHRQHIGIKNIEGNSLIIEKKGYIK